MFFWKNSSNNSLLDSADLNSVFPDWETLVEKSFKDKSKSGKLLILEKLLKEWSKGGVSDKVLIFT